jgi:hypothetical protein
MTPSSETKVGAGNKGLAEQVIRATGEKPRHKIECKSVPGME